MGLEPTGETLLILNRLVYLSSLFLDASFANPTGLGNLCFVYFVYIYER